MPDNYIARPDVAFAGARAVNEQFFPSVISGIGKTFGASKIPIYIYNVSRLEVHEFRPPNHPHLTVGACPEGQDYALAGEIEHPFPQTDFDQNGARKIEYTDGFREATVMLSPQNPGTDQNWSSDVMNSGSNLNDYGVFWSLNKPPKPEEVAAARARMEKTYRGELSRMSNIERKSPQAALDEANDISRAAAEYFGESTSYYRSNLIPKEGGKKKCKACAEYIEPEAVICKECGAPQGDDEFSAWMQRKLGMSPVASARGRKATE